MEPRGRERHRWANQEVEVGGSIKPKGKRRRWAELAKPGEFFAGAKLSQLRR